MMRAFLVFLLLSLGAADDLVSCQISNCFYDTSCNVTLPGCPAYDILCANITAMMTTAQSLNDTELRAATEKMDMLCSAGPAAGPRQAYSAMCFPDCPTCYQKCRGDCDYCKVCVVDNVCYYQQFCADMKRIFNGTNTQPIQTWLQPIQKECDQLSAGFILSASIP